MTFAFVTKIGITANVVVEAKVFAIALTPANVVNDCPFRVCQFTSWLLAFAFVTNIGITENVVVEVKVFAFAWILANYVNDCPLRICQFTSWLLAFALEHALELLKMLLSKQKYLRLLELLLIL